MQRRKHVGREVAFAAVTVGVRLDQLAVDVTIVVFSREPHADGLGCGRGAMLDAEHELVALAAQVERGVDPCVEVATAAQVGISARFVRREGEAHG